MIVEWQQMVPTSRLEERANQVEEARKLLMEWQECIRVIQEFNGVDNIEQLHGRLYGRTTGFLDATAV